jgi:predicted anti-sigma-YlaC factor YlaD
MPPAATTRPGGAGSYGQSPDNRAADVNDNGQCAQARQELGVYLLGAVEAAQRALVDRHLAVCPRCRAELAGLAGLPSLLRRVPVGEALRLAPDAAAALVPSPSLTALARRVSGVRRRWRLTAVAAAVAGFAAAAGLHALYPAAGRAPAAAAPRWAVTADGANRGTGAWAAVRYTPLPWGTEMEVQVTGVAAGTRCQLMVTGSGGQDVAAGGWTIAAGHPAAWYPASVPFQAAAVRGFVVSAGGKILVTVRAR